MYSTSKLLSEAIFSNAAWIWSVYSLRLSLYSKKLEKAVSSS
jgi:hypothetical protein